MPLLLHCCCLCFVGQRICGASEGNVVAGSGTYIHDGFIYASLAGYVTRDISNDKMVTYSFLVDSL